MIGFGNEMKPDGYKQIGKKMDTSNKVMDSKTSHAVGNMSAITPVIQMAKEKTEYEKFKDEAINKINFYIENVTADDINPVGCKLSKDKKKALFLSVKNCLKRVENMNILFGKAISLKTGARDEDAKMIFEIAPQRVQTFYNVIKSLSKPIGETVNDIYYWGLVKGADQVSSIFLTDSDLHERGIGVCIVDYRLMGGWFFHDHLKLVIKPEDKTLERTIYGSQEGDLEEPSLATDYNRILLSGLTKGISGGDIIPGKTKIGKLRIETSQNNHYGSAVEFFEHFDIHQLIGTKLQEDQRKFYKANVQEDSVDALLPFASLLGLADLHHENAVYGKKSGHMQLIDAEIAMKYELEQQNPLESVIGSGEMLTALEGRNKKFNYTYQGKKVKLFLHHAKQKLQGKRGRIVPLSTGSFYTMRTRVLCGDSTFTKDVYFRKFNEGGLMKGLVETYRKNFSPAVISTEDIKRQALGLIKNQDEIFRKVCIDFKKGKIPFFEYDFSNGAIYQKFSDGTELMFIQDDSLKLDDMMQQRCQVLGL